MSNQEQPFWSPSVMPHLVQTLKFLLLQSQVYHNQNSECAKSLSIWIGLRMTDMDTQWSSVQDYQIRTIFVCERRSPKRESAFVVDGPNLKTCVESKAFFPFVWLSVDKNSKQMTVACQCAVTSHSHHLLPIHHMSCMLFSWWKQIRDAIAIPVWISILTRQYA